MHREIDFENELEQALLTVSGYEKREKEAYDPAMALFPSDVIVFVQKTQPQFWSRIIQLDSAKAEAILLDSLVKELAAKGRLPSCEVDSSALAKQFGWPTSLLIPGWTLRQRVDLEKTF